jgi:hypothetical protein
VTVRDVMLKDLSGYVYVDMNGDGTKQENEPGIAGITISLTGTAIGATTPFAISTRTGEDGSYSFVDLLPCKPGTQYTLTETQPSAFIDGLDAVGDQGGILANDSMQVQLPLLAYADGAQGQNNNFGEYGLTTQYASIGLRDLLHSELDGGGTLASGMIFDTDASGTLLWHINLGSWNNYVPGQKTGQGPYTVTFTGQSMPVTDLTVLDNPVVKTLTVPTATGRMRQAYGSGGLVTHIIGDPTMFGLTLHAPAAPAGEGEAGMDLDLLAAGDSAEQYAQAVDSVFADSANLLG